MTRAEGFRRKLRGLTFQSRLLLLVALGVSLPALATCIILGLQLDRQARTLFSSGLQSNLGTFSLLAEGQQKNAIDGLRRAAVDNAIQVTVELGITSQLEQYLDQQAGVIGLDFIAIFDRNGQLIATAGKAPHRDLQWRLAALGSAEAACTVREGMELHFVECEGATYIVSVAPILRNRSVLGTASTQSVSWLGFLVGGSPVATPNLLAELEEHRLGIPLLWADDILLYSGGLSNVSGISIDVQVREYDVDGVPYLGASKTLPVGNGKLRLGLLTPLEPLKRAVLTSVGTVAMIGALAVLSALLVIGLLANRMLKPIGELRDGALRIGQGDFSHRISVASGDEFETLARQFNEMSEKLENSYGNLETQVAERTRELSDALDQQIANAEVLRIMSRSAFDLNTVLKTLIEYAVKLCNAGGGAIWLRNGDSFTAIAMTGGFNGEAPEGWSLTETGGSRETRIARRAAAIGDVVNLSGPASDQSVDPSGGDSDREQKAVLALPIKGTDRIEGLILLSRPGDRPFAERQVELTVSFADQAAIALKNVRLLDEVRSQSREIAQSRLRRFLAPQVAELLLESAEAGIELESHRTEVTVLFCDLRGFTAFAESVEPEEVMTVLREYHKALGELIFKYQGTLERFLGDGLMVVFNDPIPIPDHGIRAVRMAIEMRDKMVDLSRQWSRFGHRLGFGIGLAQGYATVGPIGFDQRLDYSVIGSVPNLASRLCDNAKPGQVLVSQRVYWSAAESVEFRPVGELALRGFQNPVAAYEVVSQASDGGAC